jgi:dTDP-4-amino-4,6-dideoxygalactose transaminase
MPMISGFLEASYGERYFSNFGPNVRAFEQELAKYLGIGREVITVSNATSGLAAVLLARKVRGLVAIPSYTFAATASAVYMAGCEPYPVDVNAETWELDIAGLRTVLDHKPIAAVIHVRPLGLCRPLAALSQMLADRDIPFIVDSAAAFGGRDSSGEIAGGSGLAEVFSFHATKPFGIGEGGAVAASPEIAEKVRMATNFGLTAPDANPRWGVNAKMSEFHAAVGRAVLQTFEEKLAARRLLAATWMRYLQDEAAQLPALPGMPPWQVFPVRMPGNSAKMVNAELASVGIESRIYYQPALCDRGMTAPPVARALSQQVLCLPISPQVDEAVIREVADIVKTNLDRGSAVQEVPERDRRPRSDH